VDFILAWVLISCLHGVALGAGANIPPSLLLANELGPRINVAKYLVSEKYEDLLNLAIR
jgi:hypothetical protein